MDVLVDADVDTLYGEIVDCSGGCWCRHFAWQDKIASGVYLYKRYRYFSHKTYNLLQGLLIKS
jgi:hypothetical protein